MPYQPRGVGIEQLLAVPCAAFYARQVSLHSAPCVRVSRFRQAAFEAALLALRNQGLVVVVDPDVAVYWWGLVRVHRVHISTDASYLARFVG